ncbi:hypothetical protein EWM64_g7398 [Hericium alpestre]|uniref:BTB domain-containing protein n=1 Tax=Hericium alpestre TaxID=135208 RepID=A0A4Y9ZPV0_9AGAM|nr:hypothetical protein EWM64_g7398 [Hericium alpestre]
MFTNCGFVQLSKVTSVKPTKEKMNPDAIFTRRDTLYFDDGNIVLAANLANNTGSVIFKVHKSIMAAHSPVFASMFSLPNAGTASEAYDGVPLVRMPDPAEDLQKLLEALYCKPPHTPSIARPVLALSTKYEIAHLRQLIVERLEADWPQTLDKWDVLEGAVAY